MSAYTRRISTLLREHAAELRARADRIDALAVTPLDITIEDIAAEVTPLRTSPLGVIARIMIDAARER